MQHPPSASVPPCPPRALPDSNVDGSSIEDAFVAFILYCNPAVPPETDTAALREAFRTPPRSGGKSFSTVVLFQLIKKLDSKELKTWAELALRLGVEPPDHEKGQSSQRIQQYAVRLKRWMHSMHVDAFFEYLMGRESPYWTQIPSEHTPIAEVERDGVAAEDDMALRALLPQIRPRRGRKRPEDDGSARSPPQRPSPRPDHDGRPVQQDGLEPWTARPDGRGSVFLFPPLPGQSRPGPGQSGGPSWGTHDYAQTPLTACPIPQSAITPSTRNAFWADEPKSAITPSKARFPSPTPGNPMPATSASTTHGSPGQPQPSPVPKSAPPRPAKRSRLSLQVPERVGGEVRLATPPLPAAQGADPVVMANGQSAEPRAEPANTTAGDGKLNTIYSQSPGTFAGAFMPPGAVPGPQQIFSKDPTDRTNMGQVEVIFVSELLRAGWYDANHGPVPPGSVGEASALSQQVIENLLRAAPTNEAFLINLAALAGGMLLLNRGSLRVTRLEELPDRTRYSCVWQLRYGDIAGGWTMEETVMHGKWKTAQTDDDGASPGTAGGSTAGPNGTGESPADHWERKYKELAASLQRREEDMMRLKAKVMDPDPASTTTVESMPVRARSPTSPSFRSYVVCGRPVPRLSARHMSLLLVSLALFALFSLIFTLPSAIPAAPSLRPAGHAMSIPAAFKSPWMDRLNPFKQPSHAPARQKNDTDGDSWWYADWKWLSMPFSSSITLDESRSLLPVLPERTPIYGYYDNTATKDRAVKDADSDLLLAWRRAWWAHGFKPIILSPAEATNNPMYEALQRLPDMAPSLRADLMPWLAWENMGGGLLANRLLFPMGPHHDPLLTYMRRGEFPKLTRWKDLDDGLFVGAKNDVAAAIKLVMASPHVRTADEVLAAVKTDKKEDDPFTVDDSPPQSLAYYSQRQMQARYDKVAEALAASRASGLKSLAQLINSHLHTTWQNVFSNGIAVVKPLAQHTAHLTKPAAELASQLAHCSESPMPNSCPPNLPRCTPCDDARPLKITTPPHYLNTTALYTLGTVPHPYTTATLASGRRDLDIAWIRRESPRDPWITDLTAALFSRSPAVASAARVLRFKEAVAADISSSASLWLPAEQPPSSSSSSSEDDDDLSWHFGFARPSKATYPNDPNTNTNNNDHDHDHDHEKNQAQEQQALLARAQTVVQATRPSRARAAVEAWNLADTEAWRFARAYRARQSVERRRWDQAEARYAGGMGSGRNTATARHGWDRWLDRK
ncbi:hypothetical protein BT67DRAFT_452536 [Trichocladium antarcticum]|uniref:Uncharacterized protein n=1 Tax=Trichocladium antarcticum TaxID=1450529 RepID=A0AAN6UC78_9PEZI|nr:hypothetical protein BT67DRAFT_452536 [Trichocladium antarcticum]